MASDVARFLRKQYLDTLRQVTSSSDSIFRKFQNIGDKLKNDSTYLTTPESISLLYDLNDALTEWRILKEQKKYMKRIFSCSAQMNERFAFKSKVDRLVNQADGYSRSPTSSQPSFLLDRVTFYESGPSPTEGFDEHEKNMVDLLSAAGEGFKSVGIYGMGGSGKTTLVRKVLKHPRVSGKFEHKIIWACLSGLTCKEEIDIRIVKYLLNYLGYDVDRSAGNQDQDEDRLKEELERRLVKLRNYVVVFDDVWHCNEWFTKFCRKLCEPKKNTGGAVIVTSRIKKVVEQIVEQIVVEKSIVINLNPWNYEKSVILEDRIRQGKIVEEEILLRLPLGAKMLSEDLSYS